MNKTSVTKHISRGGILTALTVLLQSAPLYLPLIGLILSPLSTLSLAIASAFNPLLGIIVFLSSGLLLLLISLEETLIFVFSTGILGLMLGLFNNKNRLVAIIVSSLCLFIGLILLTNIYEIDIWG